jgi:hypothetical protein
MRPARGLKQEQDPAVDATQLRVNPRHIPAFTPPAFDEHSERLHVGVMNAATLPGEVLRILVHLRLRGHLADRRAPHASLSPGPARAELRICVNASIGVANLARAAQVAR